MYSTKTKKSSKNRASRIAVLAVAAVLVLGGTAYALFGRKTDTPAAQQPETSAPKDDFANLEPGTEEDQQEADRKKDEATKNESEQTEGDQDIKPVITFAGVRNNNIEVRAYVAEVYESTGTCTATFTKDSQTVTKTVEGIKDATYTRCDRILVNPNEFEDSGDWTLVVSYRSPTASGESESQTVTIP